MLMQKRAKLKSTSVQRAFRSLSVPKFRFSAVSRRIQKLALGRTGTERGSFNYYGSQIFPSHIINEELSSRSISPEPTSSIADASGAAAQKKKQYETLTKEEEKYCASLKWIFEKGKQFD